MANLKVANKGGQGGRLGHSNMEHWTYTEEVKRAARKRGRTDAKTAVRTGVQDAGDPKDATATPRHGGRAG